MSRANSWIALSIASAVLLIGCAESRSELDRYISDVKQRPGKPLPPLPVMQTFPPFEYTAQGMRDPFTAVMQDEDEQSVASAPGEGPQPIRDRRKEELESFPLDSLDMVGTIGGGADIYALVKDPSGVVHRVRPNNYLGQNHGHITGIYEDRIELVELFPNGLGGYEERRSAIALDD